MSHHHENCNTGFLLQRFDDSSDGNAQAQRCDRKGVVTGNQRNDMMSVNLTG